MRGLKFGQGRIRIRIVHVPQQLPLCKLISGRAIATYRDANETRDRILCLALSKPHRECTRGRLRGFDRPACLESPSGRLYCALMFSQPPPLRISRTWMFGVSCLLPMKDRAARSEVVAGVCSVNAIDGVLPQISLCRRFLHRFAAKLLEFELIDAAWEFRNKNQSFRYPGKSAATALWQARCSEQPIQRRSRPSIRQPQVFVED